MKLIAGVRPGAPLQFTFDGQTMEGFTGESIVSALLRAGILSQRVSAKRIEPRGYYCGMGLCWECAVRVKGEGIVRGCAFPLRSGLDVRTADESLP